MSPAQKHAYAPIWIRKAPADGTAAGRSHHRRLFYRIHEAIMEAVITTDRLTRKFGSFTAVNEISFEVMQGEIFGFLGANGAGNARPCAC
jgi:ABC-type uncharacterized transport system ATPase subunit